MPRNRNKAYTREQRAGTEFGGNTRQNGTQPVRGWKDLSAADQAMLIKRTGQDVDPAAPARTRHFEGQTGPTPKDTRFVGYGPE